MVARIRITFPVRTSQHVRKLRTLKDNPMGICTGRGSRFGLGTWCRPGVMAKILVVQSVLSAKDLRSAKLARFDRIVFFFHMAGVP